MRRATCVAVMSLTYAVAAIPAWACAGLATFVAHNQAPALADHSATCATSRVLGGATSVDCYWSFPYRADAAQRLYADLSDTLNHCAQGPVLSDATGVNHPDSFDQITGVFMGHSISVSIKDKAALGRSLVF
ncbi:MAG: hypothetical protein ACPGVS_10145, partial [Primorskyibacter sp.]